MIRYRLSRNARILFVGINPHYGSYSRGVPFSNNKMFWYLLSDAGIIDEKRDYLRNDRNLRKLYDEKFVKKYHLNIINIVDRPTRAANEIVNGEEAVGNERLLKII